MAIPQNYINVSVLNDTLKDFKYYKNKIPMYLRQSEGFIEHFKIWYDVLVGKTKIQNDEEIFNNGLVAVADILFNLLDIFDKSYLTMSELHTIETFNDEHAEDINDTLDKIALLFGLQRNFRVQYYNNEMELIVEDLSLTNEELLTLTKIQIIKNYCNGSYEQLYNLYTNYVDLPLLITTSVEPATANIYLANASSIMLLSDSIKHMFLAGLLTIQQMGITYRYNLLNLDNLLFWSSEDVDYTENVSNGWGTYTIDAQNEEGGELVV